MTAVPGVCLPAATLAATGETPAAADDALAEARARWDREGTWRGLLPPGVLGYLVASAPVYEGTRGTVQGTTHTTLMSLDAARREAKAHGCNPGREWFPVEVREVPGA